VSGANASKDNVASFLIKIAHYEGLVRCRALYRFSVPNISTYGDNSGKVSDIYYIKKGNAETSPFLFSLIVLDAHFRVLLQLYQ